MLSRTQLVAVGLAVVAVAAVADPAVAVSEPREGPSDTRPPVQVYVSEPLDVSTAQLSSGGAVGSEETTFTVDPTAAGFDGIQPGAYYANRDSDIRADVLVVRPQAYSLVLRDIREQDVTGGTVDAQYLRRLSATARYNVVEADRLDLTVTDPAEEEMATGRITSGPGSVTLDLGTLQPGQYTVRMQGSSVEAGNRSVTVRVRGEVAATPTAGGGHGFGVVAAFVGVPVAVLLARRR
jgi:hypothetical protein